MNFKIEFEKGQKGLNKGIPFGKGLESLTSAINGLQRGMLYGIAAAAKVGKTTLTDVAFVLGPYLYSLSHPEIDIQWIYFSFEIDRITKEFDFATHFLYNDYNINSIKLPKGVTHKGNNIMDISSDYLRGRVQDDNGDTILIDKIVFEKLKIIYKERLIPLFGEFSKDGEQLTEGKIKFVEEKDNPTGLRNYMIDYATSIGSFKKMKFFSKKANTTKYKVIGFQNNFPNKYVIVVTDHLRKLSRERGYSLKENIDKWIEYQVELRNWCNFTFVDIIHLNRSMSDIQRAKFMGDRLFPTAEDIKDTGNLSEEANHILTMFSPNDDKYNLRTHFGKQIKTNNNKLLYPKMRTLHLVESRHTYYPQHFRFNMLGNVKHFEKLIIK